MNLINYLNQPFPKLVSRWKLIILISLFVAFFLIVFQPFGIHMMENNKLLTLSGYGLVTFIALFINLIIIESIFTNFFSEKNWKIWKEFTWLIWIIFSIGLGNAFYTDYIVDYFLFNFMFFVNFQLLTVVIGLIPTTILIISKQKYLLKKHLTSANDLNKKIIQSKTGINEPLLIRFYADNDKDFIEFNNDEFYFIESSGNYIEIYLFNNDKIIRKTFRSTLKRALDFFNTIPEVVQCHRAFIVNANKIISAKGNSQGLRLSIENYDYEVPVSRGFVNIVKDKINLGS